MYLLSLLFSLLGLILFRLLYIPANTDFINLKNKSVLFVGPADVKSAKICNPLNYDYVVLPNNMCKIFDKQYHNLIIMTNGYFAENNSDYIISRNPCGILCTSYAGYQIISDKLIQKNLNIPIITCPFPSEWPRNFMGMGFPTSLPLGLSFFLQFVVTYAPESIIHVTGVTFYDNGQQYRKGYKLLEMGEQHNVENDKEFARRLIKKYNNIIIAYPLN
jgi:hypothetical protein